MAFFFSFTDDTDAFRENALCIIEEVNFSYRREFPQPRPHSGEVPAEEPSPDVLEEKPDTLTLIVRAYASEETFRSKGKKYAQEWLISGVPFDRHLDKSMHKQAYEGVLALPVFDGAVSLV